MSIYEKAMRDLFDDEASDELVDELDNVVEEDSSEDRRRLMEAVSMYEGKPVKEFTMLDQVVKEIVKENKDIETQINKLLDAF